MSNFNSSFPEVVCPLDQLPLSGRGIAGALRCAGGHHYELRGGIPRLLLPESNYAEAFGTQWQYYRVTQLDSYTKTDLTRNRLRRCLGEGLWTRLQNAEARVEVLEAGCGAGRFTEVLLSLPAASVTSTDISSAVEPNQINCAQSDRHRIIQCDIGQFPFRPAQYDIVVCLGVVQHTRNTEKTIGDLYRQVRPGGWLVIDHYEKSFAHYTRFGDMILRPILRRLPPDKGLVITKKLTRWFLPLHRAVRKVRPAQMLLSRVSPVLAYYQALPELNDKLQYEWAELDTHDSLTDYYKHLRTPRQIRATLMSLGAADIWVDSGGNGIEARCQRPIGE